jgi:hypothetical protein
MESGATTRRINMSIRERTHRFQPIVEALEDRFLLAVALSGSGAVPDWFDTNLKDASVRNLTRSLDADHVMSRTDMLAVFQQVAKDNTVSSNELSDLRTIVANPTVLGTPDYVRNLAGKVVNGDPANARYLGGTLGNLRAGSSGSQLNKLSSKWFLGTDHPRTSYPYARAAGKLFGSVGPVYQDVRQGYLGDCYLLASLGETALRSSQAVKTMFIDNGDQTWTVRYYVNGKATYVTVDRYVPTYGGGRFIFANMGRSVSNANEVLWVALAEKAYAQLNESGVLGNWWNPHTNSYSAIEGGDPGMTLQQISGRPYSGRWLTSSSFTALVNAWNSGKLISFGSKETNTMTGPIVPNHAYALLGYNATNKTFTVFNPWGINNGHDSGLITLTWAQMVQYFDYWAYA